MYIGVKKTPKKCVFFKQVRGGTSKINTRISDLFITRFHVSQCIDSNLLILY